MTRTLPRATHVRLTGTIDERYAQRVLRVAEADIIQLGGSGMPPAAALMTGDAAEADEGALVTVEGTVTAAPSEVADGVSFTIDDGSGALRIIAPAAPAGLQTGVVVQATGPLGQRDSGGTGAAGYRVYALEPGDVVVLIVATPIPSATPSPAFTSSPAPSPTASQAASPSATSSASASPSPSPSATPVTSIGAIRDQPAGTRVHVRGVVTAEAGRVGTALLSIQDGTAGVAVRLPSGVDAPARGQVVDVAGDLAAPYGQLEIRPESASFRTDGWDDVPAPLVLSDVLEESLEGLLVSVEGVVPAAPSTSGGDITFDLDLPGGARIRVQADASSLVPSSLFKRGNPYRLRGVVGQHASATGRLDGYRIWLRDRDDVVELPGPTPSPSATPRPSATPGGSPAPSGPASSSPTPSPSAPGGPAVSTIASAILADGVVRVRGVVTAGTGLLPSGAHLVIIQDRTAAIEIRLQAATGSIRAGRTLEVVGRAGRSYGAPRIVATETRNLGAGTVPARAHARPRSRMRPPNGASSPSRESFDRSTALVQPGRRMWRRTARRFSSVPLPAQASRATGSWWGRRSRREGS